MEQQQRLYAVPAPLLLELPSSWLPRVALSQGESLNGVKRFLGFSQKADVDRDFLDMEHPTRVAEMCGLDVEVFDDAARVFRYAHSLEMCNPIFLQEGAVPRYRFCMECLKECRTPYFPLHWRIDAYRVCAVHRCLMEDNCPHCGAMVCPLQDWAACGVSRGSHTFASQCLQCSKFLWRGVPLKIDAIPKRVFAQKERLRLMYGGVFVGSILTGRCLMPFSGDTDARISLPQLERQGMFALGLKYRVDHLRQRMGA